MDILSTISKAVICTIYFPMVEGGGGGGAGGGTCNDVTLLPRCYLKMRIRIVCVRVLPYLS